MFELMTWHSREYGFSGEERRLDRSASHDALASG